MTPRSDRDGDGTVKFRFPKSHRISESKSFRDTFRQGRRYHGRLTILWIRRTDGPCSRLGAVAAKRNFRRAVDRGRAKRLIREAYRLESHRLRETYDVVLIAKRSILQADSKEVQKELVSLMKSAGVTEGKR
jgi:ribonuclease P protein component